VEIYATGTAFSGLQVAPEYKPHPLFLPDVWEKFIDKSHLSISRTLFCYFLACNNVLGCIHVMRRLAKERQDAIDALSLADRDITTATWGPELRAQHGTSGGSFPTLCRCVQ